jgi:nodulation protein E
MVLGEGAGVIVLETLAAARRRGADVLGEIVGFGMSADADGLVRPSVLGPVRALDRALDDAALDPSAIDYVNAHGSGTRVNDVTETEAIHRVFGGHAGNLAVSSTKSMHGHALGASGALEFIAAVLALRNGVVPPTANYREADPDCDLDYVPNTARERRLDAAVSTSFAFGGLNAALVARRFH